MNSFKKIKYQFDQLSHKEKENLLRDIYNFSVDSRLFLESRLLKINANEFVRAMKKETVDKVYANMPKNPDGRRVKSIISKAKKSFVNVEILMKLEQLAYQGFIEYLNEYGGGPDNFDDMACNHLEAYLILVKNEVKDQEKREKIFQEINKYLLAKDNMCTDSLDDIFELTTGMSVGRI